MQLTKIDIRNYRLLVNADLNVDKDTTLIVGRNNSAKTSCMELVSIQGFLFAGRCLILFLIEICFR